MTILIITNNQALDTIKIMQIGLGPLGLKISQYINDKQTLETVAAVDIDPNLSNKDLGGLVGFGDNGVKIKSSLDGVNNKSEVDVVVLSTSSSLMEISKQIGPLLELGLPIISTCEELTYPWDTDPEIANSIDKKAIENNVAVVSTGVNPGFLMDTLPSMLTGVCKSVRSISVNRIQDAQSRRLPFQMKIGAGLSLDEFEKKRSAGTLRHVGLTESMQFIADAVGWELDQTEDVITPVVTQKEVKTSDLTIPAGNAIGVRQEGRAFFEGKERIKLIFEAAVGTGVSYDEVNIVGEPNISSRIEGGVHGDIATCSIVLNTIPNIINATPGLKTMKDLSIVSIIN